MNDAWTNNGFSYPLWQSEKNCIESNPSPTELNIVVISHAACRGRLLRKRPIPFICDFRYIFQCQITSVQVIFLPLQEPPHLRELNPIKPPRSIFPTPTLQYRFSKPDPFRAERRADGGRGVSVSDGTNTRIEESWMR